MYPPTGYTTRVVWTMRFSRAYWRSTGYLFQRGWWGIHLGPIMLIVTRSRRIMRER